MRKPVPLSIFLLSFMLLHSTAGLPAESAAQTPPATGLLSRQAIVLNATAEKVYAVDAHGNTVTIVDCRLHTQRSVQVGEQPVAMAVNPRTNRVYVANAGSGTVTVLDGSSDAIVATIDVGKRPYVLAVDPDENKVYVSNTFSNQLTIVDGATNRTTRLKVGSADAMAVEANHSRTFLLGYESPELTVLNGRTNELSKLPAGQTHLWGIALDEAAGKLYVTRIGSGDLAEIDLPSHRVQAIKTGAMPCAVAVNRKTRRVYVANYQDNTVTVIDAAERKAIATLPVGSHPQAIAVDEKSNLIYVANTHADSLTVIDGARERIAATLPAGKNPFALAVVPGSGTVYVANQGKPSLSAVNVPGNAKP